MSDWHRITQALIIQRPRSFYNTILQNDSFWLLTTYSNDNNFGLELFIFILGNMSALAYFPVIYCCVAYRQLKFNNSHYKLALILAVLDCFQLL